MFRVRLMTEAERLTCVTTQPMERLILETNAELRKCEPMQDREGLGRWALSVPFLKWTELRRKYPDLASTSSDVKSRAWLRFINSPESGELMKRSQARDLTSLLVLARSGYLRRSSVHLRNGTDSAQRPRPSRSCMGSHLRSSAFVSRISRSMGWVVTHVSRSASVINRTRNMASPMQKGP